MTKPAHPLPIDDRAAGPRTWRRLVVGSAFVVIAIIVFSLLHDPRAASERTGPFAIECTAPKGSVTRFTDFRARGAKPPGGWFRFEVFDASAPAGALPVLVGDRRPETLWTPTQDELRALPVRVRWRVSAVSAEGAVLDAKECEAQRAP